MENRCSKCNIIFVREFDGVVLKNCPICGEKFLEKTGAIVPNFFNKENLEEVIDKEISDKDFIEFANDCESWDLVSDLVRDEWNDWKDLKEEEENG